MNETIEKAYRESYSIEEEYENLLSEYIINGFEIEELTKGSFQLEKKIEWNEIMLRGLLLETDLCKDLEAKGQKYKFQDLKEYVVEYGLSNDATIIIQLIQQYEKTLILIKLEKKYITNIITLLSQIISKDLLSREKKHVPKTQEQLLSDYKEILNILNNLYLNENKITEENYNIAKELINKLFNKYMYGSDLPVEKSRYIHYKNT